MKPIAILGLGMQSGYPNVTAQERVNCYLEYQKDGEKTNVICIGTPGLVEMCDLGSTPVRGAYSFGDYLYVLHRSEFWKINNAGVATSLGTITSTTGRVSMACNGIEIILVDGTTTGYFLTLATDVFTAITDMDYPGLQTVCFMDGYFLGNKTDTGQMYKSGSYNANSWDALEFVTAESNPDNLVAVFADRGMVYLLGDFTTEVWSDIGVQDFPFARSGVPIELGLTARWSVAKTGNAICMLARNRLGQSQVVMLSGYSDRVISTPDLDRILNDSTTLENATAFSYMTNGHPMYQLNAAGRSFLYDISTGVWSTVKGYGLDRHRGEIGSNLLNKAILTDYDNGKIYQISDTAYDDNGEPLVMTLSGKHVFYGDEKFSISELFVDMQTGVGTTTGQGVNPQIMLEVSRNGGNTFGNAEWKSFGGKGEYPRVNWMRKGRGRDFVFRLTISDPVKRCIIGAWVSVT